MNLKHSLFRGNRPAAKGFTLIELLVVIAIIAILASMLIPALARAKDKAQNTVDLNNVKQILTATSMFATDNNDSMPHPSWGGLNADPGPNNWAYATQIPGRGQIPALDGAQYRYMAAVTNQHPFFREGQLGPNLAGNPQVLECPKDVVMRGKGIYQNHYYARQMRLTAYTFTGAVSGYGDQPIRTHAQAAQGGTYKISDFQPTQFLLWETDETRPFNFNDASQNQDNRQEGVSQRHASSRTTGADSTQVNLGGGAMLGTFGMTASFTKWGRFNALRDPARRENDLFAGPGYR